MNSSNMAVIVSGTIALISCTVFWFGTRPIKNDHDEKDWPKGDRCE